MKYPNDYKSAGVLPLCNHGGLAVMEFEHGVDTYVYIADHYGDDYKNITRNKIYHNAKGNPYFVRYGKRYYLNDFMRV